MCTAQVIKVQFASEFIYNKYKDMKTCGVVEEDLQGGVRKVRRLDQRGSGPDLERAPAHAPVPEEISRKSRWLSRWA